MAVDKASLDERLKSLRIDRRPEPVKNTPGAPRKTLLTLSALVVLVAVGLYYFFGGAKTVSVAAVRTEAGSAAAGQTVLTASGYVVAAHKISVGAKVLGRVEWIGVDKGDKVQKGQVLVRLENTEFRAGVDQARANLAAMQARLDQLRAGSRPQEKAQGRATVVEAEASVTQADLEHERIEQLYRAGVAARAELDRAVAARDVARARLAAVQQTSAITDIGPRAEEIRAAEAQVAQMRAALAYAQTQLASTEIAAPVSGTILQRIVEQGEMVSPSAFGESGTRTAVVALADLTDLQIELDISQTEFARLRMGQRAEITPEAYPDLRYVGFLEEMAPEANRAKATVQVKVKVENPDEQLRPEMNARVNFLADAAPVAGPSAARVLVPQAAVVRRGENDFVFVVKGSAVEQRTIRRGETAGDAYAVLDGLSGGERVVVTGAEGLRDGDRVEVAGQ